MALHTVSDLKASVSGLLSGTNLENVTNLDDAIARAARIVTQLIDAPESVGNESIILYSNVFDYPAPPTIFGASIVDLRPQGVSRKPWDYVYKRPTELFDRTKDFQYNGYALTFDYYNGQGIMRVATPNVIPRAILDPMTNTDGWNAGGSASGLVLDQTVFYTAPGSLRFTLTGASMGYLEKSIQSQNLTDYQGVGVVFIAMYTPIAADLTSMEVRLGSDSANYIAVSATTGFLGAWTDNEWTLVAFNLAGASTVGSPNFSAIDYLRISETTTATIVNFRLGGAFIALPSPHEVIFETAAIFLTAGGQPSQNITDDGDTIILNDAAYTILEYATAETIAMQQSGGKFTAQITGFNNMLYGIRARNGVVVQAGLVDVYRADNPSQELRMIGSYYDGYGG